VILQAGSEPPPVGITLEEADARYVKLPEKHYYTYTVAGDLTAAAGTLRVPNRTGASLTISGVYLDAGTAPTGAAIIADVHENGTTIFTTQSNRPQIAAGATSGSSTTIEAATWENGNYLTVDIDQIGSTIAGADLTVTVVAS